MPAPGATLVLTPRYAFVRVPVEAVKPSRPASCASGRIAINLPPLFTHVVKTATWLAVSDIAGRMTTS
jgi:hypothetical protein